jgi:hypothetical protein
MVLRIARAGVVFPVVLPEYGQSVPAHERRAVAGLWAAQRRFRGPGVRITEHRPATMGRLVAAERHLPADQVESARSGADLLIIGGLSDSGTAALVAGVGDLAATAAGRDRDDLLAAATLAVATVFTATPAQCETSAGQWLNLLAIMHHRGTLAGALRQRGIR